MWTFEHGPPSGGGTPGRGGSPAGMLPEAYRQDPDSNTYKLLALGGAALEGALADVLDAERTLDLDQAFGKTLDYYGEMLGQLRGAMTDTQYRFIIRSRLARNFGGGDYRSVVGAVADIFETSTDQIWMEDDPEESGLVHVRKLPFAVISGADFTAGQALDMIKPLLPIGVRVQAEQFEGTFEFADKDGMYDEEAGFARSEADQSIGGTFGFALGEDDSKPLPV